MAINFRELFALRAKRWMVPAATIAALVAAGAPPAWAADYFVTNATDSGAGSLRQAILDLNTAGAGTHSIAFSSSLGTISIANDLPPILGTGQNITITGNGNTVDGGTQHALLFIGGGVVEVSDLNLSNGHAQGGKGGGSQFGGTGGGGLGAGGALFVNDGATVTISGVAFTGNQATGGSGGDPVSPEPSALAAMSIFRGAGDIRSDHAMELSQDRCTNDHLSSNSTSEGWCRCLTLRVGGFTGTRRQAGELCFCHDSQSEILPRDVVGGDRGHGC